MRKIFLSLLSLTVVIQAFSPFGAYAVDSPAVSAAPIVISEVQTASATSANEEFVELYNAGPTDVDLTGWILKYKSAVGASWTTKATLTGHIKAYGYFLLAPTGYLSPDKTYAAGLSAEAGHVAIYNPVAQPVDVLGWGAAANSAETAPASAPPAGQSLERLPGRLIEDGGNGTDTDNNSVDFVLRNNPAPQNTSSSLEDPKVAVQVPAIATNEVTDPVLPSDPIDPTAAPADNNQLPVVSPDTTQPEAPASTIILPLQITELLVDPASPATDTHDEFIELYNPNAEPIEIGGYSLRTGSNFHDYFVLPAGTIDALSYLTVYSDGSGLSLTNSGGAAQLLDASGVVVSQTSDYGTAETGQSFALFATGWLWTTTLTPGAANIMTAPQPKAAPAQAAKKPAAKKAATAKPKAAAKPKTAKVSLAKAKTTKKASAPAKPLAAAAQTPAGKWLLIAALLLTIGYAIYEFRYDIQNLYIRIRRHGSAGL